MNYSQILENSFENYKQEDYNSDCKYYFLADAIFDFTTYDDDMSSLLAKKCLAVCEAITNRTTFEYIKDPAQYENYLTMINMAFFKDKLSWGTSVRGAWWGTPIHQKVFKLQTYELYSDDEKVVDWEFTRDQWDDFMQSVLKFVG